VKVTFFAGASLRPLSPVASKGKDARHIDLREGDKLDEAQMATWLKVHSRIDGGISRPRTPCSPRSATSVRAGTGRDGPIGRV
jgi:hypothetical protein